MKLVKMKMKVVENIPCAACLFDKADHHIQGAGQVTVLHACIYDANCQFLKLFRELVKWMKEEWEAVGIETVSTIT